MSEPGRGNASWPARYPGACSLCPDPIEIGDDMVVQGVYDAPAHENCASINSFGQPVENPVCQTCWLAHPEGACDR